LRPSDIQVVGAIGDSLTAANGGKALTIVGVITQYRGMSWSIGGDADIRTVTTVPNILKLYNKNLKGFSVGTGKFSEDGANFNLAQPGHKSQ
jgi:phospholipase B1